MEMLNSILGLVYIVPYTDRCRQLDHQNRWLKRRRENWICHKGPCSMCGSSDNLEVDHIDPLTKISHRIWSWSEERRLQELKKCQVLCRSCHLEKTKLFLNLKNRGEGSPMGKLNRQQVIEIRKKYKTGKFTYRQLSKQYSVTFQSIYAIVKRQTWKHIQ